jgi:hypothetical protein
MMTHGTNDGERGGSDEIAPVDTATDTQRRVPKFCPHGVILTWVGLATGREMLPHCGWCEQCQQERYHETGVR